jgi:uncharacterized protein with beta-barrel porin domain/membrane-associated phospholipid phosphatase
MRILKSTTSIIALLAAGAAVPSTAIAQNATVTVGAPITISPSSANVLNLLSPFLSLNSTSVGQTTLSTNLSQAIATNNGASLTLEQLGESDENLLGSGNGTALRTQAQGYSATALFGVAANLGGGLPTQAIPAGGTIAPTQAIGGLGVVLGGAYATGINASTTTNNGPLSSVAVLLNNAYTNFTSVNLGVAKNYFADGGGNSSVTYASNNQTVTSATTNPAVAPAGYTLPTFNGLPNTTTSVYDNAYGVTNRQSGQDVFGSSRPDQVTSQINSFDPTALSQLAGNPSFPSGHATYAYTDSILLGMLVPQEYQSMLYRASAYANSRIVVGVHYPLDIIGSRALATYDLAQAFTNPAYINNAATTGTAINLPANFTAASAQITPFLTTAATTQGCGTTIASCAASSANTTNDPYAVTAANASTYTSNLTYGLPTLTFAQAPREAAPTGGPDASILLEPIYGGNTSAATAIATSTTNGGTQAAGITASLATSTINQIIVNTETNALAAFYGTSLSYWTRIDLAAAAGYFGNAIGTLTMASSDVVNTNVTIGNTGVLYTNGTINGTMTVTSGGQLSGTGTINGATAINAGGILAPGSATSIGTTNINGSLTFAPGAMYNVRVTPFTNDSTNVTGTAALNGSVNVAAGSGFYLPQQQYTLVSTTGGRTGSFSSVSTNLAFLVPTLSYNADNAYLTLQAVPFSNVAQTSNQSNVGAGLTRGSQTTPGSDGALLIANLQQLTVAQGANALDQLSGQGIAAAQNAAFRAGSAFAGSIADQTTFWRSGSTFDQNGITLGGGLPPAASGYAQTDSLKSPIVVKDPIVPILPQPRTWRIWANGFGGGTNISGTAGLAGETGNFYGGAAGIDYQFAPNVLIGIAAGGSDSTFRVASLATSGRVTGGHVGIYTSLTFGGCYYGTLSSTFGDYSNHTNRFVGSIGGLGPFTETGSFGSTEFRERLEIGRDMNYGTVNVTPFVALEIANLHSNGFGEVNVSGGAGSPALQVNSSDTPSVPLFVGGRFATNYQLGNGLALLPVLSVAYVHEFEPDRNIVANIISLPGSTFLVNGARPASNAVQTKLGAELQIGRGVALFANFDGEFSGVSQVYAGRGGINFVW